MLSLVFDSRKPRWGFGSCSTLRVPYAHRPVGVISSDGQFQWWLHADDRSEILDRSWGGRQRLVRSEHS